MIICSFDDSGTQSIIVRGRTVYFDFSYRFGPLVTNKHGEPLRSQPVRESDPFWGPFAKWLEEFKRTHPPKAAAPYEHPSDYLDRRVIPFPTKARPYE